METAYTFIGRISIVRGVRGPKWMLIAENVRVSANGSFPQGKVRHHRRKKRDDLASLGRLRERSLVLLIYSRAAGQSRVSGEKRRGRGGLHSDLTVGNRNEANDISDNVDLLIKRSKGGDSQ
jgi:hypothetical protein